ncbi:hypothetical protein [Bifidobacterium moraviense]|uniref:hypothetical protein n=1 Tax=Bifidobacterium moraviense TaxID=2675323 RepID=UPI00145C827F|nr:hypothetical protein [Bifidobacterium sp. DSM 109958]
MLGRQMTALVAVTCLLVGVGATAVVLAPHPPQVLAEADPHAYAAIETQQVNDGRSITINAEEIAMAPVVSPRSGMVTSSNCKPGATLRSGQSLMAVDGRGVLMLATAEPLWRALRPGDQGSDAAALNAALGALGAGDVSGDTVTAATLAAFRKASADAGVPLPDSTAAIDVTDMAWLPADGVMVSGCPAPVGQTIGQGQPVAELPAMAASAQAQSLPSGAVAGERVIQSGDVTLDITDQGAVGDLAAFSRTRAFESSSAMSNGVRQVSVQWVLRDPVTVGVVPASAIGVMDGGVRTCIVTTANPADTASDTAVPVSIVGSMLGRTYVQGADGSIPSGSVRLAPSAGGCA